MKKLAFSVFAAALTFGANAADSAKAVATTGAFNGFDGIYFGLGVAAVVSENSGRKKCHAKHDRYCNYNYNCSSYTLCHHYFLQLILLSIFIVSTLQYTPTIFLFAIS